MSKETWEGVDMVHGLYHVSSKGRVKSIPHSVYGVGKEKWQTRSGKILKPDSNRFGHQRVTLSVNGKVKRVFVHRLVAMAFIPTPQNKPIINHINGIPADNRVENLEWCTYAENNLHAYKVLGRATIKGEDRHNAKLTEKQVLEIFNSKISSYELVKRMNYPISAKTVRDIRIGKSWGFLTGKKYQPNKIQK